jgi:hypothetical protein
MPFRHLIIHADRVYCSVSFLILTATIFAQINIGGYVETRPYITWNDSTDFTGYNRGWVEFKSEADNYGIQFALDLIVPYDTISPNYVLDNINISRLALWLGREQARVVIGKQSLYWGVGRVFRPLDVFNRINYFEPGYERSGSNALLGYMALSNFSNIRSIVVPRGDLKNTLVGMRVGTNVYKNDIGMTAMHQSSEKRTLLGGEITGELMLGYWVEGAYTWEDTFDYSRITVGLDYTFPYMIYTLVEYYFDGSGVDDAAEYDYTKIINGERQTLAQQYIYASIGLLYNPFLRPSVSTIVNLDDQGFLLIPSISYAVLENTELTLGVNYAIGSAESEFRNITKYRGAVYLWVKTYF